MIIQKVATSLLIQAVSLGAVYAEQQIPSPSTTQAKTSSNVATSKIIVIVNKDPISQSDLDDRIKLVSLMSGMAPNSKTSESLRNQVLQSIIQEKIQIHAAISKKINITTAEVEQTIEGMAKDNGMKKDQFLAILTNNGIPKETLFSRIKAQLSWVKYIRQYYAPLVQVGEKEIDSMLVKMESAKNKTQYHLAEILLLVESPSQEKTVLNDATKLVNDLRSGANFSAIAQQISKDTNSTTTSGELGWLSTDQVDPAVANVLPTLKPGDISKPIRTTSGYKILKLNEIKQAGEGDPNELKITFCQAFFPLTPTSTQEEYLDISPKIEQTVAAKGCENFKKSLKEYDINYQVNSDIMMGQLPEQLRRILKSTPIGKCAEPIMTENGVLVQMVCAKKEAEKNKTPSRDEIKGELEQLKLAKQAAREQQRLTATAYIEFKDPSYSKVLK